MACGMIDRSQGIHTTFEATFTIGGFKVDAIATVHYAQAIGLA
jgi:hypothetical protein